MSAELVDYDAHDDVAKSFDEAYRVIRERMANGGPGWTQKEYRPMIARRALAGPPKRSEGREGK